MGQTLSGKRLHIKEDMMDLTEKGSRFYVQWEPRGLYPNKDTIICEIREMIGKHGAE